MMLRIILLATLALAMVSKPAPSAAQCLGDVNGDSKVTIDELLTAVRNSLDECAINGARFVDNRDGTVTDQKTGLAWEQKDALDGSPNPSDPHDADNLYAWSSSGSAPDGTLFTSFLFGLNAGTSPDGLATSGCFTGHCDWRLPTSEELAGIVNETLGTCAGGEGPCIDPALGPMQADGYWSATTFSRNASRAWLVDFSSGGLAE
ncbi:MAG TPA: DUF1566 domain-containing protein, partial [Candidatus Dormibacteraeota bacterium]|nr:DUF1566 domain-containing protein [Candidatus Dormibacteraeota bacterium]